MNLLNVILWLSVAFQGMAAVMALRLIPISGRAIAWVLFSIVFLFMAARRIISLLHEGGFIADPQELLILMEPIALVISIFLVVAVHLTRNIFIQLAQSRAELEEQLAELRLFQKIAVGRELRIKELKEEVTTLKTRLGETHSTESQGSAP